MPADAARLRRPVGDRDRRFFAALALLAAVGTTAGVLGFGHGGSSGATRCLAFDRPGVMGGGTWRYCGVRATAFCRVHAADSRELAAKCEALG